MPRLIIVQGYLASGKSTFAARLSQALGIPCFIKDEFKNAICEGIEIAGREEGSRYSALTFKAMMYAAERLLETGRDLIMEGNFVPPGVKKTDEEGIIAALITKYGYNALTYKFTGDTRVLYERFNEREKLPERGANRMFAETAFEDFDKWCHNLDGFDVGGETVSVDTSDFAGVDFLRLINIGRM